MNYKRIYDSIIERAKERVPEGYVERHHIIPRCMGGTDERENLVALTPEEHFLCHVLLVKIYPEQKGLIYAVSMMCAGHKGKRKSRKLYGWLKRRYSKQRSIDTKGHRNGHYGKRWIHNLDLKVSKRIAKVDVLPDGWNEGRIVDFRKNDDRISKKEQSAQTRIEKELQTLKEIRLMYDDFTNRGLSLRSYATQNLDISHVALYNKFKKLGVWSSWSGRRPVTSETAGSSSVIPAKFKKKVI